MNRSKRIWTRFVWRYLNLSDIWAATLYILFVFSGGYCFFGNLFVVWPFKKFGFFPGVPLGVLLFVIGHLIFKAGAWRYQLPEYQLERQIEKAKRLQQRTNSKASEKIDSLIRDSRASKDAEGLKKWLEDYFEWLRIKEDIACWQELNAKIPGLKSKAEALQNRLGI